LVQIISNLLNNSFKFTRQGSVGFGYRVNEHDIEFYVKDTGIGVPEDKFERIFERFYQVEIDSSRRYSGAGLGLSISKAYAEMLGGRIWLISSPEKGSEFIFNHPI
jgi:signal transduction histidine kinase